MVATWRFNVILGLTASLFTFLFSILNNTWPTSSFRAALGFLLFFVFGYMLRIALFRMIPKKNLGMNQEQNKELVSSQEVEQTINKGESQAGEPSFQAVPLQSLHNGVEAIDAEKVAQSIRIWTTEKKEG